MSKPPLPQFENERRLREAMRAIELAAATEEGFIDQAALTTPVSYVLGYRLRWWQFYLHPRSALLAVVTRRFDRRAGWQARLDLYLCKAEGFIDGAGLDPSRVYGLRYLQLQGRLSRFAVFCASEAIAVKPPMAASPPATPPQRSLGTLCGQLACVLLAAVTAALFAIVLIDWLVKGCATCIAGPGLILAMQLALLTWSMYIFAFYRPKVRAIARAEMQREFAWFR